MLNIVKCYRLERNEAYRFYYNEPVVFKNKISVCKINGKNDLQTLQIFPTFLEIWLIFSALCNNKNNNIT